MGGEETSEQPYVCFEHLETHLQTVSVCHCKNRQTWTVLLLSKWTVSTTSLTALRNSEALPMTRIIIVLYCEQTPDSELKPARVSRESIRVRLKSPRTSFMLMLSGFSVSGPEVYKVRWDVELKYEELNATHPFHSMPKGWAHQAATHVAYSCHTHAENFRFR